MTDQDIIDAAESLAAMYDDDDRQDIKTDVMNAFYAGVKFMRSQAAQPVYPCIVCQGKGSYKVTAVGGDFLKEHVCPVCNGTGREAAQPVKTLKERVAEQMAMGPVTEWALPAAQPVDALAAAEAMKEAIRTSVTNRVVARAILVQDVFAILDRLSCADVVKQAAQPVKTANAYIMPLNGENDA